MTGNFTLPRRFAARITRELEKNGITHSRYAVKLFEPIPDFKASSHVLKRLVFALTRKRRVALGFGDRALLVELIQRAPSVDHRELSRKLEMPEPEVSVRLGRLREEGLVLRTPRGWAATENGKLAMNGFMLGGKGTQTIPVNPQIERLHRIKDLIEGDRKKLSHLRLARREGGAQEQTPARVPVISWTPKDLTFRRNP